MFHYSEVVEHGDEEFAYDLDKEKGIEGAMDAFVKNSTLASAHPPALRLLPEVGPDFREACREYL